MQWLRKAAAFLAWRPARSQAWGAILDRQEILLAALSLQQTGSIRVMVYEHLHAPQGMVHLSERDDWLVQTLKGLGQHLPSRLRIMALALGEGRSRHGVLPWDAAEDSRRMALEVQLEAAEAWGVEPDALGFDFRWLQADGQVQWAACLRQELVQWQSHARHAGWRLPVVEPDYQAGQRAALHLKGELQDQWAKSPQDWQFARTPQREPTSVDWPFLLTAPVWKPLVACGAALGVLM